MFVVTLMARSVSFIYSVPSSIHMSILLTVLSLCFFSPSLSPLLYPHPPLPPPPPLCPQDGSAQVRLKNNAEVQFVSTAESSEKPSGGLLKQVAQRLVIEVTVSTFKKTLVVVSGCNTTYYPLKPAQVSSSDVLYAPVCVHAHTARTHIHTHTHTDSHTHTQNTHRLIHTDSHNTHTHTRTHTQHTRTHTRTYTIPRLSPTYCTYCRGRFVIHLVL